MDSTLPPDEGGSGSSAVAGTARAVAIRMTKVGILATAMGPAS
jgi:hypothetical protein